MARSVRKAGPEPEGTVETADTKITMHSSAGGYWQRLESGADVINYRIDFVIGSGNHASGYLLDLAGHLFQSPVAYYKSRQSYDLAPGYEHQPNPDFTRPVAEGCLFCHSTVPSQTFATPLENRPSHVSMQPITCERCHGPAGEHLRDPRAGTIVNPAKLQYAARDSVCEQCHLLGVGRVLNPGRKFGDFRAGEALEDVFTTYVNALPPGSEAGKFKVISHVEQLARSVCARSSNGALWCGTCHDPHNSPLQPVQHYRAKCLSCHTGNFAGTHPDKDSNCIGCHMPRRDAKDGGHTAFTDHRIQRRPEPEPDLPANTEIAAWRQPAADLQKRNLGIAYIDAGLERRSMPFLVRGYQLLTEVQTQFANDSQIFTSMGTALLFAKQTSEAELAYERALQLDPDSPRNETNVASAYLQAGDVANAIAHLERAVALDPLHLPADVPLIALYRQQGNLAKSAELSDRVSAAVEKQSAGAEPRAGEKAPPDSSYSAADVGFRNLQVLKGVSADQLFSAMRFISESLGVKCGYCHEESHFDKDDKKPKQVAREMMRMMLAIDKDAFKGNRVVTCYTCHRGLPKPQGFPMVGDDLQPGLAISVGANAEAGKTLPNLPTAGELLDNYVQALGGAAAITRIATLEKKGAVTQSGKSTSLEILQKAGNKQILVEHTPAGDRTTVCNGMEGWSTMPDGEVRHMNGAELDAARLDADLHFPLHIRQVFADLRVEYPENVGGSEAYVLVGSREGLPPIKLYFDEKSGLLVRVVRYAESPLGLTPTRIDYDDYRNVSGVEIPFRHTISQPDGRSVIQMEEIQGNTPIDDARFAGPPPARIGSRR